MFRRGTITSDESGKCLQRLLTVGFSGLSSSSPPSLPFSSSSYFLTGFHFCPIQCRSILSCFYCVIVQCPGRAMHNMDWIIYNFVTLTITSTMTKTKTKTAWFKKLSLDAISFNLRSVMLGLLSSLAFQLIIFQQTFFQPPREILLSLRPATSFYSSFGSRFKANTFPFFKNSDVIYFFMVRYLISSGCEK